MGTQQPIDTQLKGDTNACREVARSLDAASKDVHNAGTQLHKSRSESESTWHGEAGDAFRDHVSHVAKASDDLVQRCSDVSQSVTRFADELDSIKSRIHDVSSAATAAGLVATEKQILPPGPQPGGAPSPLPHDATEDAVQSHDQQQEAHNVALSAHRKKAEAYEKASTAMKQLRERENEAHRELATVLSKETFLDQYGTMVMAKATTMVATGHTIAGGAIEQLKGKINGYDTEIASIEKKGAETSAGRLAASTEVAALRTGSANAAGQLADMQQVGKATKAMGGQIFAANPGSLIKNPETTLGKFAKGSLKRVPYAGALIAGASAAKGIHDGKPAAKEVEKAVGDTGASIAAGAAVGTMVGGPVGTVVGVGVGWVASVGVDHLVDWKNGPIEQANRALGLE